MGPRHEIDQSVLIDKRTAKRRWRAEILNRWGSLCAYCGEREATTLDHVRPRHRGGQTTDDNLVAACERCNRHKGSEPWREWFERQTFFCPERAARIAAHVEPAAA